MRGNRGSAVVPAQPLFDMWPDDDVSLARRCGLNHTTVHYWRKKGTVSCKMADEVACALGVHVLNIWPDFHERYSR